MTKTRDLSDFLIEGGADLPLGVPHIIPGVLYPGYDDKQIDGTTALAASTTGPGGSTVTSSKYGTVQSDGRMYYYTDIKGSKPIKDPRIGAHFGSQRHTIRSRQLLEQETATHGKDIYSLDGRDWFRLNDNGQSTILMNDGVGNYIEMNGSGAYVEVVGYFNAMNVLWFAYTSGDDFNWSLNGASAGSVSSGVHSNSPLGSRFVSAHSVYNLSFSSAPTLGINTVKITATSDDFVIGGVELIAQDTSNRNNIQIPSQNVVSHGKKFTVSGTSHYDPFSAKTDGSAWTSPTSGNNTANSAASWPTNIDTANSLGLENWVNGSSYYRPYNGGRVVKYVDSTGTIKTAVTVMPPNARSIGNAANLSGGAEKGDDSAGNTSAAAPNNNYKPTFTDQTIATAEDLHEVAKTFHWREFGNGSANGNASYADASTLTTTTDDIAYAMDDGLTSISAKDVQDQSSYGAMLPQTSDVYNYFTFIGTGIAVNNKSTNLGAIPFNQIAQNLPYGTHIFGISRNSSQTHSSLKIDGVVVDTDFNSGGYGSLTEVSFNQPKRPPIPEDACVLADYMLMADWVNSDSGAIGTIPKGARAVSPSRDLFYNSDGALDHFYAGNYSSGWFFSDSGTDSTANTNFAELPVFGTRFHVIGYDIDGNDSSGRSQLYVDGSIVDTDGTSGSNHNTYLRTTNPTTNLGVHKFRIANKAGGRISFGNFFVDSPIHTSSHYQPFETPELYELIGGDRNMEQTNLVCSPDGKTWDQITRDTSYIGNGRFLASRDGGDFTGSGQAYIYDYFRGNLNHGGAPHPAVQKNFAIAYDRIICLVDGHYKVTTQNFSADADRQIQVMKNSVIDANDRCIAFGRTDTADFTIALTANTFLKRGDYIGVRFDGATFRGALKHFTFIAIEKI